MPGSEDIPVEAAETGIGSEDWIITSHYAMHWTSCVRKKHIQRLARWFSGYGRLLFLQRTRVQSSAPGSVVSQLPVTLAPQTLMLSLASAGTHTCGAHTQKHKHTHK